MRSCTYFPRVSKTQLPYTCRSGCTACCKTQPHTRAEVDEQLVVKHNSHISTEVDEQLDVKHNSHISTEVGEQLVVKTLKLHE